MKVLITGIDGFLGREISRRLRASGWDVAGFSNGPEAGSLPCLHRGSTVNFSELKAVFQQEKPDACVHLAGLAHAAVSRDQMEPVRQVNVTGTLNAARAAAESGTAKFLFFSSAKVYGEQTPATGLDEDDAPMPAGIYAELKYEAEQKLAEMAEKCGLSFVIIRPVAVFGRGDGKGNYARLIRAVRRGVFPIVDGGRTRRSIAHLDRVAERVDRILGSGFASGKIYTFSDGAFELKEILDSVRKATGRAFFPSVPGWFADAGGAVADRFWQTATGKEGFVKQSLSRLTGHFVIRTHRYDADFEPLEPFDLDRAMAEACADPGRF